MLFSFLQRNRQVFLSRLLHQCDVGEICDTERAGDIRLLFIQLSKAKIPPWRYCRFVVKKNPIDFRKISIHSSDVDCHYHYCWGLSPLTPLFVNALWRRGKLILPRFTCKDGKDSVVVQKSLKFSSSYNNTSMAEFLDKFRKGKNSKTFGCPKWKIFRTAKLLKQSHLEGDKVANWTETSLITWVRLNVVSGASCELTNIPNISRLAMGLFFALVPMCVSTWGWPFVPDLKYLMFVWLRIWVGPQLPFPYWTLSLTASNPPLHTHWRTPDSLGIETHTFRSLFGPISSLEWGSWNLHLLTLIGSS